MALTRKQISAAPKTLIIESGFARPDTQGFAPIYCAEHFFSGPWPCSCRVGPQVLAVNSTADECSTGGARGGGKLSPLDSWVLTPFGFVLMGDVKVGDQVSDPVTGGRSRVIAVHPHPPMDIWKLTFDDGAALEVGEDHLWLYREANRRRPSGKRSSQRDYARDHFNGLIEKSRWDFYRVGTTRNIMDEFAGGDSLRFPLSEPLLFTRRTKHSEILPPYLIGLMLGDGNIRNTCLSSDDEEIQDYCLSLGMVKDVGKKHCPSMRANGKLRIAMTAFFSSHGLSRARSWEKFIPENMMHDAIERRLELLRGLMDSDGTVDDRGHVSFSSTSEKLAKNVQWMVRSLGGKASISSSIPTFDYLGEKREGRLAYRVYIWCPKTSALFNLSRKKARCTDSWNGGHEITRGLRRIEYMGKKEAQCITVSSPYGLYVADDFLVTHNSETLFAALSKGNNTTGFDPRTGSPRFRKGITDTDVSYLVNKNYRALILIEQASDKGYVVERAERFWDFLKPVVNHSDPQTITFPSGAKIAFGHFGDEGWKKYVGPEFTRIAFDQLEKMPLRETYDKIKASCRSKWPEMKTQVFSTWNPGGGDDLKGAPGQGWIMDYFHVQDYLDGHLKPWQYVRQDGGSTTHFVFSKVMDNPFFRWKLERVNGVYRQVWNWECQCGRKSTGVEAPERCEACGRVEEVVVEVMA